MNQEIKVTISRQDLYSKDYSNIMVDNKKSYRIAIKNRLVEVMLKIIKELNL